ncbi:MAG: transporter [Chitinophagaceae bacterium]|nr:MAG: transporter [Chitinophagaceae bacterium]
MKKVIYLFLWATLFVLPAKSQTAHVTSILQVMDVHSRKCTIVREFPYRIEAPFWTRDGKSLIYNSGGKLYLISTGGKGRPEMINTGFADQCNNDHVLSPDGKEIGISNQSEPDGKSRIYIVPFKGGTPRLITPNGPSYLHGWSPDGTTLSYCAERSGNFDVYTISVKGGQEMRLTDAPGLDDGPEYSPDGKYIWFNSVRTGVMQIWRMNADGSSPTQMTFTQDVYSWFPHVSPDGKEVVFLAYHKGEVAPDQHLADKQVELRIMPANGGKPEPLIQLFGGQGTMNVNSWSPDSKKIAFVSYRVE